MYNIKVNVQHQGKGHLWITIVEIDVTSPFRVIHNQTDNQWFYLQLILLNREILAYC